MRLAILLAIVGAWFPGLAAAAAAQAAPSAPPFSPVVAAGDFLYLAGMLPTDEAGRIVSGDIRVQTSRTLDNLAALLARNGSRLDRAAAVTVYLRRASDFAGMNEAYARAFPKDPPTRTTVVADLAAPDALVEVSLVAVRDGVERQVIHPADWVRSPSPYSYGIKSKDTLFLSGLISRSGRDNTLVPGDMKTQTRTVLQNAREILGAAGMTLADVAVCRVYITDTALFQDMNAAYREGFPTAPPARATVRAGLTGSDYLVEITMLAVKDAARTVVTPPNADGTPGRVNPVLSPAIRVGDRLYLSGMLGSTEENKGDAGAQTREVMKRLGRALKAGGLEWNDVVDAVVYLPDLGAFRVMNEAYRQAFPGTLPARATVGAGLVAPDGLVEIMLTAVKGEKRFQTK